MAKDLFELALESEAVVEEVVQMELEEAQEPLLVEEEPELQEAEQLDEASQEIMTKVSDDTETIVSLESIANYIRTANQETVMDKHAVMFANLALESIYNKANIQTTKLTFSLEGYKEDPKKEMAVALEGIKERIEELFTALKDKMVILTKHIGEVLSGFNRNIVKLKRKVFDVEQQLKTVKLTESKFPAIKPEIWCKELCYLETGFVKGLKDIGKEVNWLITEHTKMAGSSVKKYVDWFKQHSLETNNDFVFRSLRCSKNDFLLPEMTEFNRSIGNIVPSGNNMFYRSKELPGGVAYFTSVETSDKSGLAAVNMLSNVNSDLGAFNPASFKAMKVNLAALAGLSFMGWMVAMGNPALALGAGVATIAYQQAQKVGGTGKSVTIDKKYVFDTLTLAEAKKVIADVKVGIVSLEKWNQEVLQRPWKNKEINTAIDKIIGVDRVEVHNGVAVRYMRQYCYALLNLMKSHSVGIHTYSFRVYNALLNFTDKSLKQYV